MIVKAGNPNHTHLYFNWNLVDWCNYACSYCSAAEMMSDVFDKEKSNAMYKLVLKRLQNIDTSFEVWLLGGEPTLHKNFEEIISSLIAIANCKTITVFTNLSRPVDLYQNIKHDKVIITASYHPEFYKDTFLDKCIKLNDDNFVCSVNLSDRKEEWPATEQLIKQLNQHNINYGPSRLFSTPARTIEYDETFYAKFGHEFKRLEDFENNTLYSLEYENGVNTEITSYEMYKQGLDNFNGFKCNALMYTIDVCGEISNMCSGKRLSLFFKYNDLGTITCPHNSCQCEEMFSFYKEKV